MAKQSLRKHAQALALEMSELDDALYKVVTVTPTPVLDLPLRRLSSAGSSSRLWLTLASGLALFGGPAGRRAAALGVASLAATSAAGRIWLSEPRRAAGSGRRAAGGIRSRRRAASRPATSAPVPSACGFAFASAAGRELPALRRPLRALATAIAYSRVHTGLQPPGEALVGALAGTAIGRLVVGGVDGGGAAFLAARG